MNFTEIHTLTDKLKSNIQKVIVGNDTTIEYILTALLAGGHVLMEDVPGTGKTMLAKALASSIAGTFHRIQFTPDLMPADVTGISIYKPDKQEFVFQSGPVFTNILLADELNRATPRTQSSLLECMEEKQVTTDGITRKLENPFFLIATQNPIETTGTYPLPEAQLDRFTMKLSMKPLSHEEELSIIERFINDNPLEDLSAICDKNVIPEMQKTIRTVKVHECIREYIVSLMDATNNHAALSTGVNARGVLQLIRCCQALAVIRGREFVTPDDVKELFVPCLAHRVFLSRYDRNLMTGKILEDILQTVTVPTEDWR